MALSEQEINQLLATVSFRIRQSLDVTEILQTAVDEVRQLLQCDRTLIYRFQPDWSGKVAFESIGAPQWSLVGDVVRDPCFENNWVEHYQHGKATVHDDVSTAEINQCHRELLQHFAVRANLVAPILLPHQDSNSELPYLWGLIIAHQCDRPRQWQDAAVNLFQQLANQIAIAIQQAELLQLTQQELQQKKIAERQTREAQKFLQTVIERLPIAVYVKDATHKNFGKLKLWNKVTEGIFGLQAADILGKTVYDRFSLGQAQNWLKQDLETVETQQVLDVPEETVISLNGNTKIIHKIKVPLYNEFEQPDNLLCIAEDITNRKQAELELKRKSEELTAFSNNLKQLHRLNATNYQSSKQLYQDYLKTGCQMFQGSIGIVGIVEADHLIVSAIESDVASLRPQMRFALAETHCWAAVNEQRTITYQNTSKNSSSSNYYLDRKLNLESYIGTPIYLDGSVYGVLSFASIQARQEPFSDREKETIEMMAQSIGKYISADRIEQKRQEAETLLTQAKKELELRVFQRTAELEIANHRLQEELQEREQTQSALQASQDSLQESERRWRGLLENVRLLVVGLDKVGKVDYVNPYFLELTGYSRQQVIQQDWFANFVAVSDRQESRKIHHLLVYNHNVSHQFHHKTILTRAGEKKTIAWNSAQLRDMQGHPIGMMCIGEDVTERQAIEKMKDEFISVVSHELRTPLTSVRGALGLLNSGVLAQQPAKQTRVISIATESTEHLVRLVNDILELEKLESGKTHLIIEPIELEPLISQAIDRILLAAQKSQIEIITNYVNCQFLADGDRILQVLINLLSNALKFSEPGSQVEISVVQDTVQDKPQDKAKSQLIFSIKDYGRGIPQDRLDSIFERFHQVDASDSRSLGGTGLGLAICRSIVEQHSGKIWVESVFSVGSTFYFSLPLSQPEP